MNKYTKEERIQVYSWGQLLRRGLSGLRFGDTGREAWKQVSLGGILSKCQELTYHEVLVLESSHMELSLLWGRQTVNKQVGTVSGSDRLYEEK